MSPLPPAPCWPRRDADHLLVSGAQMAALEQQLFASGLPVEALMEKAALAVAERVRTGSAWRGRARRAGVLVLVGPGHNGGDGLVVARELHLAGWPVRIWCPWPRLKPLTEAHRRHAAWLGIAALEGEPDPADGALWIDALFGVGQTRRLDPALEQLLAHRQQQQPAQLLAIDVPSGLCSDSGRCLGDGAAVAHTTFCIGLRKQGLVQDAALPYVGRLRRIDLGLAATLLGSLPPSQLLGIGGAMAASDLGALPWPQIDPTAAKYGRGRLLVVAGSQTFRGAAILALSGASASGVGSLRAALPEAVAERLWLVQPHTVLQASLGSTAQGGLALGGLGAGALDRLDAVLLGPGLGAAAATAEARLWQAEQSFWDQLQAFPGLLVLDADGLNRLAASSGEPGEAPGILWLRGRGGPTWITPHRGEFNRLFPDLGDLQPLEAARQAAALACCSVLLKGARSVVAAADGRCWQLLKAWPGAARAGLGDVLAGFAAGVGGRALAAGADLEALPVLLAGAALAHAEAGGLVVRQQGEGAATPEAVAAALPTVRKVKKSAHLRAAQQH
ncbi:NAD(P)H-hydrate dehydratase [Synechococcus sp. CCY9201]|uniref:NAD(P)H-hydrate dehydratase n=1 Tax=unclassified Synechococcus TaxID=2626047 RepID=UPI002AD385A4|nr:MULTISPECIES: NAD(P)H-hydrate dehydratase [unclassified Synechococcus]MEA5423389.1 NAD(P)H-hydrate dehydratase [Synechococcus sp. CCY9202]MEA5473531.1 NAD(P)H-hydrate dehydratase [Synechococcus sp. CCY9201]